MTNNNFKWLTDDIDKTLVLKVMYKNDNKASEYRVFNINRVLETDYDELEIETGNINDLTNLLTLGIVKFVSVSDTNDVLEIPFRKLYLLYKNGNKLAESSDRFVSFLELDTFSVIDGVVRNDLLVFPTVINEPSDDLLNVMKIAYEYGSYGMQEQTNALERITIINHRRLLNDNMQKN